MIQEQNELTLLDGEIGFDASYPVGSCNWFQDHLCLWSWL